MERLSLHKKTTCQSNLLWHRSTAHLSMKCNASHEVIRWHIWPSFVTTALHRRRLDADKRRCLFLQRCPGSVWKSYQFFPPEIVNPLNSRIWENASDNCGRFVEIVLISGFEFLAICLIVQTQVVFEHWTEWQILTSFGSRVFTITVKAKQQHENHSASNVNARRKTLQNGEKMGNKWGCW